MPLDQHKVRVTLGGVPLAANAPVTWRLQTGTEPYVGVFTVPRASWQQNLEQRIGKEVELSIEQPGGEKLTIKRLTLLHMVPTDDTARVSFAVADLRFWLHRKTVRRAFNMVRNSGTRTAFTDGPGENQVVTDAPIYLPASMNKGKPWSAREALEDVLDELVQDWQIDKWPLTDEPDDIDLQDLELADPGNVALATLLGHIPGAVLWVDPEGVVRIGDATDLKASDDRWIELETRTIEGEPGDFIDKKGIRPKRVRVQFERQLEVLLHGRDNYQATQSTGDENEGYLENVLPTVDLETDVDLLNPKTQTLERVTVPPGTWVPVKQWLEAMDRMRPSASYPWTFETIRELWIIGDLEGGLGARPEVDDNTEGVVAERVGALRAHFRQTWRLSQRWMDRISELLPIRAGLYDPFHGVRQPASVWGECCYNLSPKGGLIADARDPASGDQFSNRTWRTRLGNSPSIVKIEPSAATLEMVDAQQGIFRIAYRMPANGSVQAIYPCNTTNGGPGSGRVQGPWRDYSEQDHRGIGVGFRVDGNEAGVLLRDRLDFYVLLTLTPASPNSKRRLHSIDVEASDLMLTHGSANYGEGDGQTLEVYVPPNQATARFAWDEDDAASSTLVDLLGLNEEDPTEAGRLIGDAEELPGFIWTNKEPELQQLARVIAAEQLLPYADAIQGTVVTELDASKANLAGAMAGVEVHVAAFPEGSVRMVHTFPGQAAPISRFGLLPKALRKTLFRTVQPG